MTKIEWTDRTWNPVTGCTKVSPGCDHCYAETFAERWRGTPGHPYERGFDVQLRPERLDQPLTWRNPSRVFVNSMSDLFHDAVPDDYIVAVFARMWWSPRHTFQVLTKRHARMRSLVPRIEERLRKMERDLELVDAPTPLRWPLPNLWLGVSVENQKWADIRIPALLDTSAAVRFLSCEPLLGPVDLTRLAAHSKQQPDMVYDALGQRYGVPDRWQAATSARVDWVIVGGESGPGARPMHPQWARSLRDQCARAAVPFHFKQWGAWAPSGAVVIRSRPEPRSLLVGDPVDEAGHREELRRVGKKVAGRLLDGRTHDAFPAGRVPAPAQGGGIR